MFNLPGAFVINSLTSGLFDGSVATFSRASNLFLCSFNSNSTLKNPKQYNMIDNTEIIEANEGKFCFLTVISVISSSFNNPRRCSAQWKVLLYTVSACYVIQSSISWWSGDTNITSGYFAKFSSFYSFWKVGGLFLWTAASTFQGTYPGGH